MSYQSIASVLTESKAPSPGVQNRQSRSQHDTGKQGANDKTFSDVMNAEHKKADHTATSHSKANKDTAESPPAPDETSEQSDAVSHTDVPDAPQEETDTTDFVLGHDDPTSALAHPADVPQRPGATDGVAKDGAAPVIKSDTVVQPGAPKTENPMSGQAEPTAQIDAVDTKPSQPVPISAQQASVQSQLAMQKPITGNPETRPVDTVAVAVTKTATPQKPVVEDQQVSIPLEAKTTSPLSKRDDAPAYNSKPDSAPVANPVQATAPKTYRPTIEDGASIRKEVAAAQETRAQIGQITSSYTAPQTAPLPTESTAQANNATLFARAMAPAKAGVDTSTKTDPLLTRDMDTAFTVSETRAATAPSSIANAQQVSTTHQPAMARHVAAQISDVLRNTNERPVEISLNPAELGRVRMTVLATEGAVTLQVLAERPETLDLMKKNMDLLARELADLGFDSIDLAFGQGKHPTSDDDSLDGQSANGSHGTQSEPETIEVVKAAPIMELDASGHLDVRV